MAQQPLSHSNDGGKPADPYKAANLDQDITLAQKIEDLSHFISGCKFGMMTTRDANKSGNLVSRCMALVAKNGGIDLLFHCNNESGKTNDLSEDPHVNLSFLNTTGEWASVSGVASVVSDRELVKKHYSPQLKAWLGDLEDGVHDGSENDPRIGIIRVKMVTAHYSISSKNILGRIAEVAQGTVTGKVASVNKLREISEADVDNWRSSH
ncbi:putative BLI-3 blue-light-inducible Bli-3 protein [Schizothecium vesticola]|uniref:BLI-3 blue-light-inducible Bli-3 protein n=1 Tax=Schizothecium vesticola TaxID=314040 RepID=A0AA40ER36_9PEZI|nr:putative BLI-3 blue-light-inducible Bli-3 protein [Schizothecium vesticola]